jgi:hypothetical protein
MALTPTKAGYYRLICIRQVMRDKDPAVCDKCREKCVIYEKVKPDTGSPEDKKG